MTYYIFLQFPNSLMHTIANKQVKSGYNYEIISYEPERIDIVL